MIPINGKVIVADAEQAAAEVARQSAAGYDFIKVYNNLSPEAYEGVVIGAEAHGLPVVGHVPVKGGLDGLRMYPGEIRAIYLGKLLANFSMLVVLEVVLVPVAAVLLQLEPWGRFPLFVGITLLGSFGFSVIGTFYASLTQHLKARELMLPLLLFPALVPVFLGAVNGTTLALAGDPLDRIGGWIRLLISFDIIFFVVCVWIYPIVLEE